MINDSTYEILSITVTNFGDAQIVKNKRDCMEFKWAVMSSETSGSLNRTNSKK